MDKNKEEPMTFRNYLGKLWHTIKTSYPIKLSQDDIQVIKGDGIILGAIVLFIFTISLAQINPLFYLMLIGVTWLSFYAAYTFRKPSKNKNGE